MGWCTVDDIPGEVPGRDIEIVTSDEGLTPMQRAARLKRYAQHVVRLAKEGRYDPEKTALARMVGLQSARQLEDLEDDAGPAFSPRQRAALRQLAARLRAYARDVGHYHTHGPGGQLGRVQMPARPTHRPNPRGGVPMRRRRITNVPIQGWEGDDEDELGFLPALVPLLGAAAPLIGGLLGGGGKKSAPAPAAPAAAPVVQNAGGGMSLPAVAGVVADQIRAVPPPIRQQVTDAVREIMDRQKAGQMDVAQMMTQITQMLGPKLKEQLSSVNNAALQRQATYEHNALKERDKRWKENAQAQTRILARLDTMEQKLGNALTNQARRSAVVAKAFGVPPRYQ